MAEQFLTLMADLDPSAQQRIAAWYRSLREAGFEGTQTPGLPYHISLAAFPLAQEKKAAEILRSAAERFPPFAGLGPGLLQSFTGRAFAAIRRPDPERFPPFASPAGPLPPSASSARA